MSDLRSLCDVNCHISVDWITVVSPVIEHSIMSGCPDVNINNACIDNCLGGGMHDL